MLALGTPAPPFALPEVEGGNTVRLEDFASEKALLVVFLCAHCPYVHHVRPELSRLARDYAGKSVAVVGITSNDTTQYPDDAPEPTARFAREAGFAFPVLYDETQEVAKAYSAACTPDFFLFGPERTLVYRGQLDDSRPNRGSSTGNRAASDGRDLRAALDAVLADRPVRPDQKASIGCNIKWKPGNAPAYFG
jgi:peroxiredoxin